MRVNISSYNLCNYSTRLNENNSEEKQKNQRQCNNYNLAFGQLSPPKGILAGVIGAVIAMCINTLSGGFFSVKLHNAIFHPKEKTVQTDTKTSTVSKNPFVKAIEENEKLPKRSKKELQEVGNTFVEAYERAKNAVPTSTKIKIK